MYRKALAFAVGSVGTFAAASGVSYADRAPAGERIAAFSPEEFRPFRLLDHHMISKDTMVSTFSLGAPNMKMGMKVASCIVTRFKGEDGKDVIRPYTPITQDEEAGTFKLLVKKYPGGKMGTHIHELTPGESLDVKGPFDKIPIAPNQFEKIGFIAGGTGITPMYQIIKYLCNDPQDKTEMSLVFANNSPSDILLHQELVNLSRQYPRFQVYYVVRDAPYGWAGGIGFINPQMLKAYMPKPGEGKVMVCGPPPMMKAISGDKDFSKKPPTQGVVDGFLKELGYSADDIFKF